MKKLVAYFSASGITARAAKELACEMDADLFEIVPESVYTAADLDWRDSASRSTLEMTDPAARPAIAAVVENIQEYDRVYVGFPIWWYVAPRIVNTFLESCDLKGKTVIPFATSGGSGIEKVNESIQASCPGAVLEEAHLFNEEAVLKQFAAAERTR